MISSFQSHNMKPYIFQTKRAKLTHITRIDPGAGMVAVAPTQQEFPQQMPHQQLAPVNAQANSQIKRQIELQILAVQTQIHAVQTSRRSAILPPAVLSPVVLSPAVLSPGTSQLLAPPQVINTAKEGENASPDEVAQLDQMV